MLEGSWVKNVSAGGCRNNLGGLESGRLVGKGGWCDGGEGWSGVVLMWWCWWCGVGVVAWCGGVGEDF